MEHATDTAISGFSRRPAGRQPHVAVVLVNYNGLDDTLRCLTSLQAVEHANWRAIVVDNGSQPSAAAAIASAHAWAEVIRLEDNGGWAGGNNRGIRRALELGADHVLLLNNDTVVAPALLRRLVEAAEGAPDCGILGPVVCYMDEPDQVNVDGCVFQSADGRGFFMRQPIPLYSTNGPLVSGTEIVNGCCMMVRAEVFGRIGLIDERFFLIHEESDFCLRAAAAGYRCGVVGEVLVWHKGSSSFQREARPLQSYFDTRNLYLMLKKHRRTYRGGQPAWRTWGQYARYVYHMYCVQRDAGNAVAAEAVLEGVCDALAGRWGPHHARRRILLRVLRRMVKCSESLARWR